MELIFERAWYVAWGFFAIVFALYVLLNTKKFIEDEDRWRRRMDKLTHSKFFTAGVSPNIHPNQLLFARVLATGFLVAGVLTILGLLN